MTIDTRQITLDFPAIDEMSGVALIVYWSQMCPSRFLCDFSLIDTVVDYWSRRSKRVILGVATVGYPILVNDEDSYETATPDWVLQDLRTYSSWASAIGSKGDRPYVYATFPSYGDPRFVDYVRDLVKRLAKYDGYLGISYVRISTGILTEDFPSFRGFKWEIAGFGDLKWLDYCRRIVDIYLAHFRRSALEFDISYLSWAYVRGAPNVKAAVDQFIDYLISKRIFLAYNGLSSDSLALLEHPDPKNGDWRSLYYIRRAVGRG
ncbi:MAG: hypothetical protein ACREBC_32670, partial [Pyrinomonadaceae bacterium]